ncbi:helix-turn-helix domain-containing protein [Streptomyces halobius]|uniref:Helix-turn-helix domain-containing protein n=1 Tax=Streptomyces halobius TaxID=2879846 RepID=A0ABY4M6D4_9ACTN|nr:helix-turn-helix transcriptional regulator [Streptomyces halobius]UQA93327.1 helix-turn-helix domain-containing protein [Streptomyces halobius]
MAKEIDPTTSTAALFGTRLRRLRLKAGLTQAALGRLANTHSTRINQVERATGAKPTLTLARALDEALGADDLLVELWPYVYREAFPNWAQAFMEHSERAVIIREFATSVVPGLLQTEDYARAVLSVGRTLKSPEQLEERLASRINRQARLLRPDGPRLWVVLDESVLMRPVGGPVVMRAQLARLLEAADAPRTTLQVLPFSCGAHGAVEASLTLLTLPDGSECAYTENADTGQLIDEPEEVKSFTVTYDQVRALALPPNMSLDMIRSVMEGTYHAERIPTRSDRRRLAQVQLQQQGGRQLRRGRRQLPGPRPRT